MLSELRAKSFDIKDLIKEYPALLFSLLIFTLPYSIKFSNNLAYLFILSLIIKNLTPFSDFYNFNTIKRNQVVVGFILFFSLYSIGLIYSQNVKAGFKTLEGLLPLILYPIIFPFLSKFKKEHLLFAIDAFLYGIIVAVTWLYLNFINSEHGVTYYFREQVSQIIELHPTYISMYAAFGVFILLFKIRKQQVGKIIAIYSLLVIYLTSIILLTGARTPLLAFLIVVILISISSAATLRKKVLSLLITLSVIAFAGWLSLKIPVISERIDEFKNTALEPPKGIHFNSINLRVAQLLCSKDLIRENFLFGIGTGDVQGALNSCFQSNEWSEALYQRNYNAHNQYIQSMLTLGIVGLLGFGAILVLPTLQAIKHRDYLYLSFIILFAICCMTESMLERNKGSFFFSTFCIIFTLIYSKDTKKAG